MLGEVERGAGGVAEVPWAGDAVSQRSPGAGEDREAAFSEA
ncbi:hypothetical protein ABZ436_08515 [Micromonospora matsumotoense]